MKLVTFELKGEERVGCLAGGVIDLGRAYRLFCRARGQEELAAIQACFDDMIAFLGDERAAAVAEEVVNFVFDDSRMLRRVSLDPEDVRLKAPVPRPPKAMICGPSWSSYVKEGRVPEFIFVLKPPTAVVGPGDDIVIPRKARQVATEVELAVVVGKPGRYIGQEQAGTTSRASPSSTTSPTSPPTGRGRPPRRSGRRATTHSHPSAHALP